MLKKLRSQVKRIPGLHKLFWLFYRLRFALRYLYRPFYEVFRWLWISNETSNFNYSLEPLNIEYLKHTIVMVTGKPYAEISAYFSELENDINLREHVKTVTRASDLSGVSDAEARYGRRLGWYALVRALKPKVVVETGIDKGLGSVVLTAALLKNKEEGFLGYYVGTDLNPAAGFLFQGVYKTIGEVMYGDSIESLKKFDRDIDIFINDSDHSADYEAQEYVTVHSKLKNHSVIIGDNAHVTDKLAKYALETKRNYIYFQEKPSQHWYPGGGMGLAWNSQK